MPAEPTAAQSEASRRNGAMGQGPVTDEGRQRSALNGTRHGILGSDLMLRPEEEQLLELLCADYIRLYAPTGPAMQEAVTELARIALRRRRLDQLELLAMTAHLDEAAAEPAGPDGAPAPLPLSRRLPSLGTLIRYRARLALEQRRVEGEIEALRALEEMDEPLPANDRDMYEPERPRPQPPKSSYPTTSPNRHERRRLEALARKRPAA